MSFDPPGGHPATPFRGRRHGRRLRPGRRRLVEELLPRLRVPDAPAAGSVDPHALFDSAVRDVWLEVGFGAGEHLAALAERHPDVGLIGCEPYINGVAALLARLDASTVRTVRIYDEDARQLLPCLGDASIGRIYVLFPDPWPKVRHAARRFIGPATVPQLTRIMADEAELLIASDHPVMIRWTLLHLAGHPAFAWCARRCADWRDRPADEPPTRYEAKARAQGATCTYLRFRRKPRGCERSSSTSSGLCQKAG